MICRWVKFNQTKQIGNNYKIYRSRMGIAWGQTQSIISSPADPYFQFKDLKTKGQRPSIKYNECGSAIFSSIIPHKQKDKQKYLLKNDDRRMVTDKREYPFSAIGKLQIKYRGQSESGTAFLIAGQLALTCAHNIRKAGPQTEIYFRSWDRRTKVINQYFPAQYFGQTQEDFAILELEHDLSKECGYFGVDFSTPISQNTDRNICHIYGYPQYVYKKQRQILNLDNLYGNQGQYSFHKRGKSIIYYMINTSKGQSGSPVFVESQGQFFVIGIHASPKYSNLNRGPLLNQQKMIKINQMIKDRNFVLDLSAKKCQITTKIIKKRVLSQPRQLSVVKYLKFDYNQLEEIKSSYVDLVPNVRHLSISNNRLKMFPFTLKSSLITLDLSSNHFTEIPKQIRCLSELQTLKISNNQIKVVPEYIQQVLKLKSIDLSHNKIIDFSVRLQNLKSLQCINVGWNEIEKLSLGAQQSRLKYLIINNNRLSEINIEKLVKVEQICCQQNKIERVIVGENQLRKLSYANFQANSLKLCPFALRSKRLVNINLKRNKIDSFMLSGNSDRLEKLKLSFNFISEVPQHFTDLRNLLFLQLSDNRLRKLPENIEKLQLLEFIDVSNNNIKKLPSGMSSLLELNLLIAFNNRLSSIPCLDGLHKMRGLYLSHNEIQVMPSWIFALKQLTKVDLSNNKIRKVEQRAHYTLDKKAYIDLRYNHLDNETMKIIEQLQSKQGYYRILTHFEAQSLRTKVVRSNMQNLQ